LSLPTSRFARYLIKTAVRFLQMVSSQILAPFRPQEKC